ncbi:MAG TPA: hypothetical protein VGY13_11265 [Solirubrobacteraceae bacterium]|jgi:Uma2 family endonuclease|nr:hypothetical protein [Solirubrobacteraceae bacterium]
MSSGVRELWLVDPDARSVTRVRPDGRADETLGEGETLTSELLAGFDLAIGAIFPFAADEPATE